MKKLKISEARKIERAVRDAHWIARTHLFRPDEYTCSVCGKSSDRPYKTCPVCGIPRNRTKTDSSWVDEAEMISAILEDDF